MNKSFLDYLNKYKNKKIMFWGASVFLNDLLKENQLKDFNIVGIIDKDTKKTKPKITKL